MFSQFDYQQRYDAAMKALVIPGDLLIFNVLYWIGCRYSGVQWGDALLHSLVLVSVVCGAISVGGGIALHIKRARRYQIVALVLRNVLLFALIATPLLELCRFAVPAWWVYGLYLASVVVVDSLYRLLVRRLITIYWERTRSSNCVVLVGSTENNLELYREMTGDPAVGYLVRGYFDAAPNPAVPAECPYLGVPADVIPWLAAHAGEIRGLYCCLPSKQSAEIVPIIKYCENHLVRFYSVPNVRNYLHRRMHLTMMGNVPCLTLHDEPLSWIGNRMVKRSFDIFFSLAFLCTLFIPICIVVAIITKLSMPGPVFFRQKRNGLDGKEFYCLKFRSMHVNADADTLQATRNDPRKTRWGNFMRKTGIDELPQFINVLLGDMSVVGPRPHMVKHTEEYSKLIDSYMVRHFVRPGITGWSQVTGYRGETRELEQMEGRVRGDIWYIEHWTFWLDLYIIYKTVANEIRGDDKAY